MAQSCHRATKAVRCYCSCCLGPVGALEGTGLPLLPQEENQGTHFWANLNHGPLCDRQLLWILRQSDTHFRCRAAFFSSSSILNLHLVPYLRDVPFCYATRGLVPPHPLPILHIIKCTVQAVNFIFSSFFCKKQFLSPTQKSPGTRFYSHVELLVRNPPSHDQNMCYIFFSRTTNL